MSLFSRQPRRLSPPIGTPKEADAVAKRLEGYARSGHEYAGAASDLARLEEYVETKMDKMRSTWRYVATLLVGWVSGAAGYSLYKYTQLPAPKAQTSPQSGGFFDTIFGTVRKTVTTIGEAAKTDSTYTIGNKAHSQYTSFQQALQEIANPIINVVSHFAPDEPAFVISAFITAAIIAGPTYIAGRVAAKLGMLQPALLAIIPTLCVYAAAHKDFTFLTGVAALAGVVGAHFVHLGLTQRVWSAGSYHHKIYSAAEKRALGFDVKP